MNMSPWLRERLYKNAVGITGILYLTIVQGELGASVEGTVFYLTARRVANKDLYVELEYSLGAHR